MTPNRVAEARTVSSVAPHDSGPALASIAPLRGRARLAYAYCPGVDRPCSVTANALVE